MNRPRSAGSIGAEKIAKIVDQIANSGLSVGEYFRKHRVPFSKTQYFRYKSRIDAQGVSGLEDGRSQGNHRKLTLEAEGFLRGAHATNPDLSLEDLRQALRSQLGIEVGRSTISEFLHRAGEAIVWPRQRQPERVRTPAGGFEILSAVALHLGWVEHTADVIGDSVARFRRTAAYRDQPTRKDRKERQQGRFTAAYNRQQKVREQRFASIEDKRASKNYSRMTLFASRDFILKRKCLAILALPLVTLNGGTRSANTPLGNALEHFAGFNYQHPTLDRFLRELKYLGISDQLLCSQVEFWQQHWKQSKEESDLPFLCYYIDGNTKALWSQKRVRQNKVTMLGRVMGCLEQTFVHDAFGHPIYFETHAGKGPTGERILGLMEKIEAALEGPGPELKVTRVLVMDSASNGVRCLRAFAAQDKYHYITALDDNQWSPEKVRHLGRAQRYEYGNATLRNCELELEDSQEKGYLVLVRAVRIDWDYGKTTVLITSMPQEIVSGSLVVKAYFGRWPHQELQFRSGKAFACLNRVAGYGKKRLPDEKMRERQKQLEERITKAHERLEAPLEDLNRQDERIAKVLQEQRKIHNACPIVDGRRVVNRRSHEKLRELARNLAQCKRQRKVIEQNCGKDLPKLKRYEKEWLRLQGKEFVYQIDVELDQIMTYFRIALATISSWFLKHCMGNMPMSLARLLHSILLLPAEIELTETVRRVKLQRNLKDPELMEKLELALDRLNKLKIQHLDERRIEFSLE
jgi:transposase